ncbi:hypothetical protein L226DRAFT_616508 [Lentinus tigrinus ALCF2SS1-7]|uniref:DUF6533 domain-containing protein n=1 Tax=Lentinus tigrinus ALCF2SS1-6 TaxID=1328759 RepID=A0A5C2RVQ9_9APHY|nr:hypothetical protein L227DRAFT_603870 [Lentinus tigrinus ALCF2SS1-6]RPD69922.1 hypothetical protein L226DRAFT_616508 [Lentinus tigrinus ALCF2SS1-7]
MSTQDETAALVAAYQDYQNEYIVFYASLMPIVYDYLINLDREVGLFWTGKITGASALYFATRYISMLYVIMNTVTSAPNLSLESCNLLVRAGLTTNSLQFLAPAIFAGLRAFVLTKNHVVSLLILILSLAPFVVNMYQYHEDISGIVIPGFGCGQSHSVTLSELLIVTAFSRGGSIIADFLLVVATWRNLKTGVTYGNRASLASIMLWNGSLYFIILFILNTLHLSFTLASILGPQSGTTTAQFTIPLTDVLVCRFLLDLQEASRQDVRFDVDDVQESSFSGSTGVRSVIFARVLGSIGSTIGHSVLVGDAEDEYVY